MTCDSPRNHNSADLTVNQRVQGSSPCAPTNKINDLGRWTALLRAAACKKHCKEAHAGMSGASAGVRLPSGVAAG
jgi:hypothetical protein